MENTTELTELLVLRNDSRFQPFLTSEMNSKKILQNWLLKVQWQTLSRPKFEPHVLQIVRLRQTLASKQSLPHNFEQNNQMPRTESRMKLELTFKWYWDRPNCFYYNCDEKFVAWVSRHTCMFSTSDGDEVAMFSLLTLYERT